MRFGSWGALRERVESRPRRAGTSEYLRSGK
jgi:hypothetical protein